jgi:tyrosinase
LRDGICAGDRTRTVDWQALASDLVRQVTGYGDFSLVPARRVPARDLVFAQEKSMRRRQFLILAQAMGLSTWFGDMAFAQSQDPLRVRKSATRPLAQTDVETYRKGVAILKANRRSTNYASWAYWANSHGTTDPIPPAMSAVWNQCRHKTLDFMTWHRAYLYFFEALIRDLTEVGDFALPYWDWYRSAAIPAAFSESTVNGQPNALHHTRRYRSRTLLQSAFNKIGFQGFQSNFEGNPHGSVHVMVGGDMGVVATSGRDPLFWAHHTNVDRMWAVWLAMNTAHKNLSTRSYLRAQFTFDVDRRKRLRTSQMLNTESLGYTYDGLGLMGAEDEVPTRPRNTAAAAPSMDTRLAEVPAPAASEEPQLVLTGQSVTIDVAVPAPLVPRIRGLGKIPALVRPQLKVVFEGVQPTALGMERGFEYRIYANLPVRRKSDADHDDFYLGVFNSFELSHHATHGTTLAFLLSSLAGRQSRKLLWRSLSINLSLISDDTTETEPLVTIESVRLEFNATPGRQAE